MAKKQKTAVEILYYQYFSNVPVKMTELGNISKAIAAIIDSCNDSLAVTVDVDAKMKELVAKYRMAD
jgi:hypothetical protein